MRRFTLLLATCSAVVIGGCAHSSGSGPAGGSGATSPKAQAPISQPESAVVIPGPDVIVPPRPQMMPADPNDDARVSPVSGVRAQPSADSAPADATKGEGASTAGGEKNVPPASGQSESGGSANTTQPDSGPGGTGAAGTGDTGISNSGPGSTPSEQTEPAPPQSPTQTAPGGTGATGGQGTQNSTPGYSQ